MPGPNPERDKLYEITADILSKWTLLSADMGRIMSLFGYSEASSANYAVAFMARHSTKRGIAAYGVELSHMTYRGVYIYVRAGSDLSKTDIEDKKGRIDEAYDRDKRSRMSARYGEVALENQIEDGHLSGADERT